MAASEYVGSIRYSFTSSLKRSSDSPDGYVSNITANVDVLAGLGSEFSDVLRFELALIHNEILNRNNQSLFEVCDNDSQELADVYGEFLQPSNPLHFNLNGDDDSWPVILVIYNYDMPIKYRSRPDLVSQAVRQIIDTFCPSGLVLAYHTGVVLPIKGWEQLGFKIQPKTGLVYREFGSEFRFEEDNEPEAPEEPTNEVKEAPKRGRPRKKAASTTS